MFENEFKTQSITINKGRSEGSIVCRLQCGSKLPLQRAKIERYQFSQILTTTALGEGILQKGSHKWPLRSLEVRWPFSILKTQ